MSLLLLTGCETPSDSSYIPVRVGIPRSDLKFYFGEPLRIEPVAAGGEDWYYHFVSWETHPAQSAGTTTNEFGQTSTYISASFGSSRDTEERPIHVSAQGYVIEPLPEGKIVRH